jgi:hypothetical protein
LAAHLYFSSSSSYSSHLISYLSSLVHLLLVYIGGSAATPSHIQNGSSVAIPSIRRPKLSHQQLHPHFIVQVGRTLSEVLQVRWAEPAGSKGYWQAFCIAGEDLRLDITQEEVEGHIARTSGINNHRESIASSPTTRVSTPSEPSIIRPSPYQPGSRDQEIAWTLAESLNIRDPMSQTLTMPVPVGTIDPQTGHVNEDDVALYRAIVLRSVGRSV